MLMFCCEMFSFCREIFSFCLDWFADYVRPSRVVTFVKKEKLSFVLNYKIGDGEITGNESVYLKEERWNVDYRIETRGEFHPPVNICATITSAEQDQTIDRKGTNVNYCEIEIRHPHSIDVLGRRRCNNHANKFEYNMKIRKYSLNHLEIYFTFEYISTIRNQTLVNCLPSEMKKMQMEGILTDFVIKTEDGNINCHKVILAARSEYFANMFAAPMKETMENVLHWEDVFDETTVQDLLHFVYTGEKPPNISKTCFSLVEAAHMCLLVVLKEMCVAEIVPKVYADNVVEVLVMGEKFDSETLKKTALNFMVEIFSTLKGDIRKLPGWNQVEPEMGKRLMTSFIKHIGTRKIKM